MQAELEWLQLQELDLKSKGADDQMPPLRKREQGLLKKLQQEQVSIQWIFPYPGGLVLESARNSDLGTQIFLYLRI